MNYGTLHVRHPDGPYSAFTINQSAFTLGRAQTAKQLVLDHSSIGNVHARVIIENGRLYIETLDAAYDVFVRGTRLVPGHRVSVNTQEPFEVGGFTLGYTPPKTQSISSGTRRSSPIAGAAGAVNPAPDINDVLGGAVQAGGVPPSGLPSSPISATGSMEAVFNPESQPSILDANAPVENVNPAPIPNQQGRVIPPPPDAAAQAPRRRGFPLWLLTLLMLVLCGLLWCVGFFMYQQLCTRAGDSLPFCTTALPDLPGLGTDAGGGSVDNQAPSDPNSVTQQFLSSAALVFVQPNTDGTVSLVSQRTGEPAKLLATNKTAIRVLDQQPTQGRYAVAIAEGGAENLYLIDVRSGTSVGPINTGWGTIVAGDFSPDGSLILVEAATNNQVQFFSIDRQGASQGQLNFSQ